MSDEVTFTPDEVEELIADEKVKIKKTVSAREQAQLLKRVALVENVVDSVKEAIATMPPLHKRRMFYGKVKGDEETAVLVLSDTHAGKHSSTYSSEVFTARLEAVSHAMHRLVNIQRSDHPVKRLVIFMIGDMVDGEGIYPTQAYHVDQNVLNQVYQLAVPAYVEFLAQMGELFQSVDVHCVKGNHGRTGKFAEETSNWDLVLYETLQIALRNVKQVQFHITRDWQQTVEIMGMKFLLVHGHQIKSVLNIPWYGVTTKLMRWKGSVGAFDCLVMGHYHTRAYADWNDAEFLMNGTFVTGDEFSREIVGMSSSTMQTAFFVHPRKKITAYHRIPLAHVTVAAQG